MTDNKQYYADSIHFLSIPEFEEKLIHPRIEEMIDRMQKVIELGRKIRDTKNKSIKNPLSKVIIVNSDKQAIEDLSMLQSYIKDELNTLEFEVRAHEEEFVEYLSEANNKEIGQVLKNKYTKELKERLTKLTREEILEYLKNGKVTIEGVEIQEGWIKVSK